MTLMKNTLMFACLNMFCLVSFADSASNDSKLALLIADSSRLEAVEVSAFDPALKAEQSMNGDESSTVSVTINMYGQDKTYVITKDGGGQILSVVLSQKQERKTNHNNH